MVEMDKVNNYIRRKTMRIRLPEKYINTIKGVHGDKAAEFLQNFNQLIAECEQRYNMYVQEPFDLSCNFVAPAIKKDGQEVVLKVVLSDHEFQAELEALLHMKGKGAVQVIDHDVKKGIMILERLQPGHTLAVLEDDKEATNCSTCDEKVDRSGSIKVYTSNSG
jgi:streptomycin 6-kinase